MADVDNPIPAPAELSPPLRAVNNAILEGLGQLADYFGYNQIMGKMYGALLLSPQPMSLDALLDHLDVSKASVSMNMRTLENMGMAREVWVRHDRRKYYEAESDLWKILTNVLGGRELREVNTAIEELEIGIDNLGKAMSSMTADDQQLAQFYIERLRKIKSSFHFARLVLNSILNQSEKKIDIGTVTRFDFE